MSNNKEPSEYNVRVVCISDKEVPPISEVDDQNQEENYTITKESMGPDESEYLEVARISSEGVLPNQNIQNTFHTPEIKESEISQGIQMYIGRSQDNFTIGESSGTGQKSFKSDFGSSELKFNKINAGETNNEMKEIENKIEYTHESSGRDIELKEESIMRIEDKYGSNDSSTISEIDYRSNSNKDNKKNI